MQLFWKIFSVIVKRNRTSHRLVDSWSSQQTVGMRVTKCDVGPERVNSSNWNKILVVKCRLKIRPVFVLFWCWQRATPVLRWLWWWRVGCSSLLGYGDQLLSFDGWQRSLYRQHSVLAQRGFDALRVCSFRQHKLSVVLSVHWLAFRLLLVFGMNLKKSKQKSFYLLWLVWVQDYNILRMKYFPVSLYICRMFQI